MQDAEKYSKQALRYLDGMTERERFTTRGFYFRVTGDYQQCVKEYGELIARYAADVVGHNQLALCSTQLRNMRRAVDEMRRVVEIVPKRAIFRDNLALYANYAGDFQTGEKEARRSREPDAYAAARPGVCPTRTRPVASGAADTYQKLGEHRGAGRVLRGVRSRRPGHARRPFLGRRARFFGRVRPPDLTAKNPDRAAAKFAALGYAEHLARTEARRGRRRRTRR